MELLHHATRNSQPIRGIVTVRNFLLPDTLDARLIDQFLSNLRNAPSYKYQQGIEELERVCKFHKKHVFNNLVHQSGREVIARLLLGDTTYTGEINYGALGSSTDAISDSDTTLTTEVARKPVASRSRTNDSVTIDFYYSKADTDGTYEEFGTFIDGTASADSGQMFNRALTGGWSKSSSEAMTVSLQVDINAA